MQFIPPGRTAEKPSKAQQNLANIFDAGDQTFFSSKHPKCGSSAEICDWVSHCQII